MSFSATYEINCQYFDGPAGFEGGIAVNGPLAPTPVPEHPRLKAKNMVQSADGSLFPTVVAKRSLQQWRDRASSYYDGDVEFMDVRTYPVVARGASGRLGAPSLIRVMGSRMDIPVAPRTNTIGQQVPSSGRLTKALGVDHPEADPMSGPVLPGRTVVMCQQPTAHCCLPVPSPSPPPAPVRGSDADRSSISPPRVRGAARSASCDANTSAAAGGTRW